MSEFKAGDKVYCPMFSTSILRAARNKTGYSSDIYPLEIAVGSNHVTLTNDGKIRSDDKQPALFHATPENHKALEQLYGVEFEKPPTKPTSKEIVKAYLDRGDKNVCCWASDLVENPTAVDGRWVYISDYTESSHPFTTPSGCGWKYATPFDPRTNEAITELPEGTK